MQEQIDHRVLFFMQERQVDWSTMKVEHRKWCTIFYAGGEVEHRKVEYEKYTILYAVPVRLQKSN